MCTHMPVCVYIYRYTPLTKKLYALLYTLIQHAINLVALADPFDLRMACNDPWTTSSDPRATLSDPRATFSDPRGI